jgi:Ca2+-binding EF-hand superfamily protein
MQVFKIFDKKNEGQITIDEVYELINKFDSGNSIIGSAANDKAKSFGGKTPIS